MRVISYYTPAYSEEINRLAASCHRLEIPLRAMGLPDRGTWNKNARAKVAVLIWAHLEYMSDALLWVDADGEFRRVPPPPEDCDIGVHYHARSDGYPSPGTVYVAPTANAYHFLLAWMEACGGDQNDQDTFNLALEAVPGIKLWKMGVQWCCIPDIDVGAEDPIIVHHQASRRLR